MRGIETAWLVIAVVLPGLKLVGLLDADWLWVLAPVWIVPAVVAAAAACIALAIVARVLVLGALALTGR